MSVYIYIYICVCVCEQNDSGMHDCNCVWNVSACNETKRAVTQRVYVALTVLKRLLERPRVSIAITELRPPLARRRV